MDALYYLALGGAVLIMVYGGIQIMRRYPRIRQPQPEGDEHLYTVAHRVWETGNTVVGSVDEAGNFTMREIERERIQKQEVCSDKSHWRQSE